jgi:polyisoprenoid-binding protein YceI
MIYLRVFIFILLATFGKSFSAEFNIDISAENSVKFISDATLENFEGHTKKIDGYVILKDNKPSPGDAFYFEVDLASLDTGMGLRNRHMRDNYLETDKFPFAVYEGKITTFFKNENGQQEIKTSGTLKIHGEENKVSVDGFLSTSNDSHNVKSAFEINLNDYKIKIPKSMFMKINEMIKIELDFNLKKVN